jgi:hypothetical protein
VRSHQQLLVRSHSSIVGAISLTPVGAIPLPFIGAINPDDCRCDLAEVCRRDLHRGKLVRTHFDVDAINPKIVGAIAWTSAGAIQFAPTRFCLALDTDPARTDRDPRRTDVIQDRTDELPPDRTDMRSGSHRRVTS